MSSTSVFEDVPIGDSTSDDASSHDTFSEPHDSQTVKVESEKENTGSIEVLRMMYFLHRNTKKKLGRCDKEISEQADCIKRQKSDFDKLYKVCQMESQVQQLRKNKDRLRHRVDYWKTKSHYLQSSSEESEIQELI